MDGELELHIVRETGEGDGIAFAGEKTIFVPGAIAGERVLARVLRVRKRVAWAELIRVLEASADRADPPCPYYGVCGGCSTQHMPYGRALGQKAARLTDCLERIGGVPADSYGMDRPWGMENPWRYRNKAVARIAGGRLGFTKSNSHSVVPIEDCLLLPPSFAKALAATGGLTRPGDDVCSLLYRTASDGAVMAALNTLGGSLPVALEWVNALRRGLPELVSAHHGQNAGEEGVGRSFHRLWGADALEETILGVHTHIAPTSFRQVNSLQAERLYQTALDYLELQGGERVVDAYCGAGILTQLLARRAGDVVGIEIVASAVEEARGAAQGIDNLRFIRAACEEALPGMACDVLVLDPPRRGCDARVLRAALDAGPRKILYISCDPATLARDVKILVGGGYRVARALAVDMFPWTGHVETVALMSRAE